MNYPLVEVQWADSSSHGSQPWHSIEDVREAAAKHQTIACWSAGYLVDSTEDQITLALGHNGEQDVQLPLTIPRSCVRVITELERGPTHGADA